MEGNTQSAWGTAAKDGLMLAILTIIFLLLSAVISNQIILTIVQLLKIVGCIWFLRYLMLKWRKTDKSVTIFKYGVMVCLFSSIVCAVFTFFEFAYLFPDMVEATFDQIYESLGSFSLPTESMDMLTKMEDNYPQVMCVSALILDFLIGLIFSAIISSANKSNDNIFDEPENTQVDGQ